ncbi:hypothetical protein NDU88_004554 [Pleurodeles waltl]|uniref:Uncharacterized protein n=1 Tax=Pleurodeles waltl TaxID=8319 RepID=A0AAV7VGJ4_PLEWA|nr:hypothetical protein NDU88_004554 [Pleurodeles waltl]
MLDFWHSGQGEGLSGCDSPHVLGGHGDHAVHQQLGRPAGGKSLPVRVGAPFRHRAEGGVKPRAVYLTSWEAARHGVLCQDEGPVFDMRPSTSRGAGSNLEHIEEELLDYDEEVEAQVASVPKGGMMETPRVVQKVVQRDHPGGRRQELVVGNLPRGEDYGLVSVELGAVDAIQNADRVICGLVGKDRGKGSVDASIQVGINSDDVSGKSEVSWGIGSEVLGKPDMVKAGDGQVGQLLRRVKV